MLMPGAYRFIVFGVCEHFAQNGCEIADSWYEKDEKLSFKRSVSIGMFFSVK